ncbi:MAG: molybdenum cofactor guanylyltransferase [Planctomycetes bacterium]|nr:molybdenum cofactor guanylyltransferase [Planctomycetota bacterium]
MNKGGIILCGGRSTRMGRDKASLPFGTELMLQRVIRLLSQIVDERNIVVVAAPQQVIPDIANQIKVVRDAIEGEGPLRGMSAGFHQLEQTIDAVYVTSCDVPLLVPQFVERMFDLLTDHDIAVPVDGEHYHPLAAVYRPTVVVEIDRLLAEKKLRPRFLFELAKTRAISVDALRDVDSELQTLENLNTPVDYERVLTLIGRDSFKKASGD